METCDVSWLPSLSEMLPRFTHIVARLGTSFLFKVTVFYLLWLILGDES
jgi:hypothetical protein